MEVCCSEARRELHCSAGRQAALGGEECSAPDSLDLPGQQTYKDCCLSCTLGIIVASMGQECDEVNQIFTCPLHQPFSHCCTEIAGPVNDTSPDQAELEEETSAELPETTETTEIATDREDICPVGFQYNALIHVCDDVDECSDESLHSCSSPDEVCYNTVGSFVCEAEEAGSGEEDCPPGYNFFLVTCIDINECADDTHECPQVPNRLFLYILYLISTALRARYVSTLRETTLVTALRISPRTIRVQWVSRSREGSVRTSTSVRLGNTTAWRASGVTTHSAPSSVSGSPLVAPATPSTTVRQWGGPEL